MSCETPENLKYTKEHEWADIKDGVATVGITDFAQSQLGDIVFVELPEIGQSLDSGAPFGVVESIKSVSDLYSPLSGEVVEINSELEDAPESLNSTPYGSWLVKIKLSNEAEVAELMGSSEYSELCAE